MEKKECNFAKVYSIMALQIFPSFPCPIQQQLLSVARQILCESSLGEQAEGWDAHRLTSWNPYCLACQLNAISYLEEIPYTKDTVYSSVD